MEICRGRYEITATNGKTQVLTIARDECAESPREWDNVAEFIGIKPKAKRYNFCDTVLDKVELLEKHLKHIGDGSVKRIETEV